MDDLGVVVNALGESTPGAPTLQTQLGKARDLEGAAVASCQNADLRGTRRTLRAMFRKLGRARAVLATKKFKNVPGRDQLLAEATQLRLDVRTLKREVACPADATLAIGGSLRRLVRQRVGPSGSNLT